MRIQRTLFLVIIITFCFFKETNNQDDDFYIQDIEQNRQSEHYQNEQNNKQVNQNQRREFQYFQQRRTACLVLSRYYINQFNSDIQAIVSELAGQDQQKFINKLYTSAVQKCEPIISQQQVFQFYTANDNFDPSQMFYIFDGFNFNQLSLDFDILSVNQQNILKFIKKFDTEMQIKKEEQEAQKIQSQREQGIQLFFIPIKNLPTQMKYVYIIIVILIVSGLLYWALDQLSQKPEKKTNKRRKKQ